MDNSNGNLTHQKKKVELELMKFFSRNGLFYDDMDSFLKDFVSPRPTESNLEKLSFLFHIKITINY